MANGLGVYEEFLNMMRSDTMEEVTPSTQVTWSAVENTTIGIDKSLLDFDDLRDVLTQLASPGEGWGRVTEKPDTAEAVVATALTINEAFTWMATFPGIVLTGTFTLGGKC
jgi:phosphoglycolate phosphatase-like HAD superfamily hydrolase